MDRLSINDIIKAVSGIGKNIKEKTIDNIVTAFLLQSKASVLMDMIL